MSFSASCDPVGTVVHAALRVPAATVAAAVGICGMLYADPLNFFADKVDIQSCQRVGPDTGMTKVVVNGETCCMKRDAICSGDK